MIVMLHSGTHGRMLSIGNGLGPYTIWFHFVEALSICSVDVFVFISGYFLCTQEFKPSRILKIIFVVIFYSVSWFVITTYVFHQPLEIKELIRAIFPISYHQYWFISCYIGMYLLSPLINVLVSKMNQNQHLGGIILLIAVFGLWPDLLPYSSPFGISDKGYNVLWFIVLYVIAAYFRKYPIKIKSSKAFGYYIMSALILLAIWIGITVVTKADSFVEEWHGMFTFYYYRYNSLLVLATAIFLFLTFVNIKIEGHFAQKAIASVAPLTMGIYLIHDNESARDFVWNGLRGLEPNIAAPFVAIGYVMMVFVACLIIEEIRSLFFSLVNSRTWYKSIMKEVDGMPSKINHLFYTKTLTFK